MLILALVILRIIWRLLNIQPPYPLSIPAWEKVLARSVQFLFYVTMLLMPISGILMSQAAGYPVKFFDFYTLPPLIAKSKYLGGIFHNLHEYTAYALVILLLLHIASALKHHYMNKNQVLVRMLPFQG